MMTDVVYDTWAVSHMMTDIFYTSHMMTDILTDIVHDRWAVSHHLILHIVRVEANRRGSGPSKILRLKVTLLYHYTD
jgi:hypothetical protein